MILQILIDEKGATGGNILIMLLRFILLRCHRSVDMGSIPTRRMITDTKKY